MPPDKKAKVKPQSGQVVMVDIIEQPSKFSQPIGRISEVLGTYADPGMEIEIALRKHDLPYIWPSEVEALEKKVPKKVSAADMKAREDLRDYPFVTIDGETAKDFDDAVYCEKQGKGFRLLVAIADVSHYVKDGDALDREARLRGNSVYFPRRVIPMLPEALSNELCSLKPAVDRLCMVADMEITDTGAIRRYKFYPAVMHSRARLTYTQVWGWLSDPSTATDERSRSLLPHLQTLYALYQVLATGRDKRGAIDFESVELALVFDAHGKIEKIVPAPRNDAHKLIEECMLAANVSAADLLAKAGHPALYRVHEGPTPEKLEQLKTFLAASALSLSGGDSPTAMDYAKLLDRVRERPDFGLLQTVLLRSLQQARYRPDNVGHFGLAYEAYAHFTSPIRRYPDLLVHRAIRAVLAGGQYKPGGATWPELGVHCSLCERRADDATRDRGGRPAAGLADVVAAHHVASSDRLLALDQLAGRALLVDLRGDRHRLGHARDRLELAIDVDRLVFADDDPGDRHSLVGVVPDPQLVSARGHRQREGSVDVGLGLQRGADDAGKFRRDRIAVR